MTSPRLASSSELLPRKKDGTWIKNVLEGDGLENSNFAVQRELHSQAVYTDLFYHSQTNQNNAMFGLFVVLGGGYSTRQGSEDQSEAALPATDAAKLGKSWRYLTAFCLEVLHFNILFFFFSDTCPLIILIIFLCIIVKICIISLGCGFNSGFPQCGKNH